MCVCARARVCVVGLYAQGDGRRTSKRLSCSPRHNRVCVCVCVCACGCVSPSSRSPHHSHIKPTNQPPYTTNGRSSMSFLLLLHTHLLIDRSYHPNNEPNQPQLFSASQYFSSFPSLAPHSPNHPTCQLTNQPTKPTAAVQRRKILLFLPRADPLIDRARRSRHWKALSPGVCALVRVCMCVCSLASALRPF